MINSVIVCGAGTMGSGIAQVCAQRDFHTILYDLDPITLDRAKGNISASLHALEARGKLSQGDRERILGSILFTDELYDCIGDLIIEAVVEKPDVKIALFNQLAEINHSDTIFTTNTSSLSVSDIAAGVQHSERVCGLHFFNPAPQMKLVEVVKTDRTKSEVIEQVSDFALALGKTPVICKDSPGFIVNRVARHFYLESLRLVEQGICSVEGADRLLESAGFRMGPFRLMDLIGNDINHSVTRSLYEACGRPERFKPSPIQEEKVQKGELGRKSGKGFYEY
jgi:3-hydroxybutyryl-CoA dehydrogenase